jgi:hypothetical protein
MVFDISRNWERDKDNCQFRRRVSGKGFKQVGKHLGYQLLVLQRRDYPVILNSNHLMAEKPYSQQRSQECRLQMTKSICSRELIFCQGQYLLMMVHWMACVLAEVGIGWLTLLRPSENCTASMKVHRRVLRCSEVRHLVIRIAYHWAIVYALNVLGHFGDKMENHGLSALSGKRWTIDRQRNLTLIRTGCFMFQSKWLLLDHSNFCLLPLISFNPPGCPLLAASRIKPTAIFPTTSHANKPTAHAYPMTGNKLSGITPKTSGSKTTISPGHRKTSYGEILRSKYIGGGDSINSRLWERKAGEAVKRRYVFEAPLRSSIRPPGEIVLFVGSITRLNSVGV